MCLTGFHGSFRAISPRVSSGFPRRQVAQELRKKFRRYLAHGPLADQPPGAAGGDMGFDEALLWGLLFGSLEHQLYSGWWFGTFSHLLGIILPID